MLAKIWTTLALLGGLGTPLWASVEWITDYQKAIEKSAETQKPVVLFFTGSDWSGWGMKMKKEILDSEDFSSIVGDQFVFVEIDFPLHKVVSEEEMAQNEYLKNKLEINEYPRLVILDHQEREIARLGYSPEQGGKFAEDLLHIVENDQSFSRLMEKSRLTVLSSSEIENYYRKACELQRTQDAAALLEQGLKSEDPLFFLIEKYRLLVEEGLATSSEAISIRQDLMQKDPDNKKKTQFSLALIDFQALASLQSIELDPSQVIKPLEDYISTFGQQDAENAWQIEMMIAQFYLDYDQSKVALKHAERALATAPMERQEEIRHSVDYIQKQVGYLVEVHEGDGE